MEPHVCSRETSLKWWGRGCPPNTRLVSILCILYSAQIQFMHGLRKDTARGARSPPPLPNSYPIPVRTSSMRGEAKYRSGGLKIVDAYS